MITYGYTVKWKPRGGGEVSIGVSGCSTPNEAFLESFAAAKRMGYKRPTWWQLLRWLNEIDYERVAVFANK